MSVVATAARPSLLAPLRGRDFRLLWSGSVLSLAGDQLTRVALAWLALQITRSPLATGGVLAVSAIPSGVLGLLGGAVSDRLGPRRVGVVTTVVRAAGLAALALLVLSGKVLIGEVYVLAAVFGAADAFYGPSRASLLARTVPADQLEAATGLEGSSVSLLNLVGPAVAGVLIAKAGTGYAFCAATLAYVGVAFFTAALDTGGSTAATGPPAGILSEVAAGLRYAFADPVLRALIVMVMALTFAISGPESVGLATLARVRWGGPIALGLTLGAFGGGSFAGSLLAGALPRGRVLRRLVVVGVVLGVGLALIGVAPNAYVAMTLTAAMGVASGFINVLGSAWLMRRTDPAMMGRLMSLLMVTGVGLAPLSMAGSGALAQLDPTLLFSFAGALMLAVSLASLMSRTVREAS